MPFSYILKVRVKDLKSSASAKDSGYGFALTGGKCVLEVSEE